MAPRELGRHGHWSLCQASCSGHGRSSLFPRAEMAQGEQLHLRPESDMQEARPPGCNLITCGAVLVGRAGWVGLSSWGQESGRQMGTGDRKTEGTPWGEVPGPGRSSVGLWGRSVGHLQGRHLRAASRPHTVPGPHLGRTRRTGCAQEEHSHSRRKRGRRGGGWQRPGTGISGKVLQEENQVLGSGLCRVTM